jgi:predicted dehydrogenase
LRVAVIGVGHLGQHHARLLAEMPGVELVGVVDTRPGRAEEVAARHGTKAFAEAADVAGLVDAVCVAVPTESHVAVALPFIERQVAVLVEKPLAASVADADRLLEAARRRGTVLGAGHTERFNPAVVTGLPLVQKPRFIEVHRLGTFPERSLDIDVIFDLMIHDLDLLLAAAGEVVSVEAVGVNVLTPRTDIANARLKFASGCIANVTASRISRERVRKARFFQEESYLSIDYAAQEVEMYRLVAHGGGRPQIQGGRLDVANDEPLRRELADFVDAVRNRRPPAVDGRAGRDALELATRIAELI